MLLFFHKGIFLIVSAFYHYSECSKLNEMLAASPSTSQPQKIAADSTTSSSTGATTSSSHQHHSNATCISSKENFVAVVERLTPEDITVLNTAANKNAGLQNENASSLLSSSSSSSNTINYHNNNNLEKSVATNRHIAQAQNIAMANTVEPFLCAACNGKIVDRYMLRALDKLWHEDCLKCDACSCRLAEVGKSFFVKYGKIYCRRDYARLFGAQGICSACNNSIPAFELVMRANNNVYHLECFGCQECNLRFCVGDKFYLDTDNNKILCEYDYNERLYFAQFSQYGYNSLAHLKRQISQVDDFDDSRCKPFPMEKRTIYYQQ